MSVMIETSVGNLTIDLHVDECPIACTNFLKLCKIKYYNNVLFFNIQPGMLVQTGDPTGTGEGGSSVWGLMGESGKRYFKDEILPSLKHTEVGSVGMAHAGEHLNASQFYITTRPSVDYLDGKNTVFAQVVEGLDVLMKINDAYIDDDGRPYQDIRIKHTYILFDPFDDPLGLEVPDRSPPPGIPKEETVPRRLADDAVVKVGDARTEADIEESIKQNEAKNRAVVLEMIGDLPDADVKPPENVLFVCKLNPVTTDEDLELLFSQFGDVLSCEIIRDPETGDSLQYAFVEFAEPAQCEQAYFKMNNVLVDDRRIKVDFSQSVSKLWNKFAKKPWEERGGGQRRKDRMSGVVSGGRRTELEIVGMGARKDRSGGKYGLLLDDDGAGRPASGGGAGGGARAPAPRRRDAEPAPRREPRREERPRSRWDGDDDDDRKHRKRSRRRSSSRSRSRSHGRSHRKRRHHSRSRSRSPARRRHRRDSRDRGHRRSRSPERGRDRRSEGGSRRDRPSDAHRSGR